MTSTRTLSLGSTDITLTAWEGGRTYMLLHGGGGPFTMAGFAGTLSDQTAAKVLLPTHPGFAGTSRPVELDSTRALAAAYIDLLDELDLTGVTLVGNSFGGWLAAEVALLSSDRVAGLVIVNGVGIEVPGHPPTSVAGLTAAELAQLSFHDPALSPAARGDAPKPDLGALIAYAGPTMSDPTLVDRLGSLDLPTRVLWGESDGIVDVDFGRAYAAAIPGATFTLLPRAGHLPQVETPEQVLAAIV